MMQSATVSEWDGARGEKTEEVGGMARESAGGPVSLMTAGLKDGEGPERQGNDSRHSSGHHHIRWNIRWALHGTFDE